MAAGFDAPQILAPALVSLLVVPAYALQAPLWIFYRELDFARQRKLQAIEGFKAKTRKGVYWGIRTDVADYDPPGGTLPCPAEKTLVLAATKTRLERMPDELQERLINWGYAVCDAGMRTYVDGSLPAPAGFPYPQRGVG